MPSHPISAERALRFVAHEGMRVRTLSYAGADSGQARDMLEAALLLLPAIVKVCQLPPMDDSEARAFSYQLKQELSGLNAHDNGELAA